MMGSGKSTIGQVLSQMLGVPFSDLDNIIESDQNTTIPDIFSKKGESGFRTIEKNLLIKHAVNTSGVMALGGGALQNQQIVDHIKKHGWLVFLDTPLPLLIDRLKTSEGRPMLNNAEADNPEKRIRKLLEERLPYYHQAHITIQAGSLSKDSIAKKIIKKLKNYEA
jgi:shikimate kinase